MISPEIKALYEETEKAWPDLFKEVYPKRIIPPSGNFLNPKLYAASAAGIVMSSQLGITRRNFVVGGIDLAVQRLIELKVPTYSFEGVFGFFALVGRSINSERMSC